MSGLQDRAMDYVADKQDWVRMKPSGDFTVSSTSAAKVAPILITGALGRCFEKQTNQVKVLRSGVYYANLMFMAASVGNTTSVKQVSIYVNGTNISSARMAIGTLQSVTQVVLLELSTGDILTMHTQFLETSGTRKLSQHSHIDLFPVVLA